MKEKKVPMRMCVGCREMKPKVQLLRVVKPQDGDAHIDRTGRSPGRGAYICGRAECLKRAIKQRQLERAFECPLGEETHASLLQALNDLEAQA